ncbi:MAG: MFS transporter [Ardenticatenaceae bacterium]
MIKYLSRLSNLEEWEKTLWVVFFSQLVTVVGFASIFPFLPLYVQSLGSRLSLSVEILSGLVFSSQAFTMMIASPIWGAIADRFGRKLMVERAMFGGAIIVFLMGYADSAETLILLRAVQGLVTGSVSAANALIAATVPRKQIGFAMGLMQVALWGGIAIGPLIGGALADAFGYRLSFVVTAGLLLVAGVMVRRGVNEKFEPPEPTESRRPSILAQWRSILATPGVKVAYTIRFLSGLGQIIVFPIAPLFIMTLLPADAPVNFYTGLIIGVGGMTSTLTAVTLGRLGDRMGHRTILLGSTLLAGLCYLPQALVSSAWQLLFWQALAGAGLGGIITSLTALLGQYTQRGEEGSVYGLDGALVSASRVIAPLAGASIAYWFSMRLTFTVTGVLYLLIFALVRWQLPRQPATVSTLG